MTFNVLIDKYITLMTLDVIFYSCKRKHGKRKLWSMEKNETQTQSGKCECFQRGLTYRNARR